MFRQNNTGTILCKNSIPPECISEVTCIEGKHVLFKNEDLCSIAPGDRKLKLTVGPPIKSAELFLKAEEDMKVWPDKVLKTKEAIAEESYYKNYDKNFNDEQMCKNCKRLLFKGIKICLRCKKALINCDNPNEWSDLQNKERIDFANAHLTELLWKSNVQCRSLNKPYGEKAKKLKGKEIFHRCVKKGVKKKNANGERERTWWKSCEHRWKTDKTFMRRMQEVNNYSIEDMREFDIAGNQPKKPIQKMSKQERTKKFNEYKWRLAQRGPGGSDTVPTDLYPRENRQAALVEGRRPRVTLKESAKWWEEKGSSSWRDYSWKDNSWKGRDIWDTSSRVKEEPSEEEPKQTPSSSSTTWQQNPWQRTARSETTPPWRTDESKQKRRKP